VKRLSVGKDVEAICRKCGEVWHVVVAFAAGKVAKVECKQCGARHRYRPVDGHAAPAVSRLAVAGRPARGRRVEKRPVVEADVSRPQRSFRTTDRYQVGDRIVHASFGKGVVQAITGAAKIEVLFPAGPKILVHGRGSS
jgi:hypothetical protein